MKDNCIKVLESRFRQANKMKDTMLIDEDVEKYLENSKNISMGILKLEYVKTSAFQDLGLELNNINKVIRLYIDYYSKKHRQNIDKIKIEFINYGDTSLVFVLTDEYGFKLALNVKQPKGKVGVLKQELETLKELGVHDSNVIVPFDYLKIGNYELYTAPYFQQARSVASVNGWGTYIPEPYFRFEPFNDEQTSIVTQCIIAKLISSYNTRTNEGLSACEIGNGDFILPKDWEKQPPTYINTLEGLKLCSARGKIKCSLDEYVDIIRAEFSKKTFDLPLDKCKINLKNRMNISAEDINRGIVLGLKLLKAKQLDVNIFEA